MAAHKQNAVGGETIKIISKPVHKRLSSFDSAGSLVRSALFFVRWRTITTAAPNRSANRAGGARVSPVRAGDFFYHVSMGGKYSSRYQRSGP